ncbi:MAG: ATP-binding protein [Burkholderiales bacterium]
MSNLDSFIARLDSLLDRMEPLLPPVQAPLDFAASIAFRWRKRGMRGGLEAVSVPHGIRLDDLKGVDRQAELVARNSLQFVEGRPANNVLLTGARGTGKSSLVKAVLNEFAPRGLRLVEVEKNDLLDLADIIEILVRQPYRFILFSDDLSFEADEPSYKALKAVLDGSVAATPENVLLYATSNRRHLMPEYMRENLETRYVGDEIHPSETVEEKVSLSERFGLWVSFYPFDQEEYLDIVHHWLRRLGVADAESAQVRLEALQWALMRGSRSGRVAWHFARDWAGRHGARP